MSEVSFTVHLRKITEAEGFADASREELRVLLALIAAGGSFDSEEELASLSKASKARCLSALTFWSELGVIEAGEALLVKDGCIKEEFKERLRFDEIDEVSAKETARQIRDEDLAETIEECAKMAGEAALSPMETKKLVALHTQYGLSAEYILTLANFLSGKEGRRFTVHALCNKAVSLANRGIDNAESLEVYIKEKESESPDEWEFRRILGIYNRASTPTEKTHFRKWSGEYGYGAEIVALAYDITVSSTGKLSYSYMEKILGDWHKAGCKTLEECKSNSEAHKEENKAKYEKKTPRKDKPKSESATPRYGNFDANEAFKLALERSFGEDE